MGDDFKVIKDGDELTLTEVRSGVRHMLDYIGEDTQRDGLQDTPKRVVKALHELTWGQRIPEEEFLKGIHTSFELEHDQMIAVRNIKFTSLCEHHVLPFMGVATVAYIPNSKEGKIIGISKLARIVEYYAARLQVQERMTCQIADAVQKLLTPIGIGVWVDAMHSCMSIRGVKAVGSSTVTSDLRGVMKTNAESRAEFLALARRNLGEF